MHKRLVRLGVFIVCVAVHNVVHETFHWLFALLTGEPVTAFRLFGGPLGTSEVVFAAAVEARLGWHWLLISWGPALLTTSIGWAIYALRHRLESNRVLLNLLVWYAGLVFLCLDPAYFGVLSWIVGGDPEAAAAVGWSPLGARLAGLAVLAFNIRLMMRWTAETRRKPERYE